MILKDIGAERPRRIPKKGPRFPDAGFVVAGPAVPHATFRVPLEFVEPPVNFLEWLAKPENRLVAVLVKG